MKLAGYLENVSVDDPAIKARKSSFLWQNDEDLTKYPSFN